MLKSLKAKIADWKVAHPVVWKLSVATAGVLTFGAGAILLWLLAPSAPNSIRNIAVKNGIIKLYASTAAASRDGATILLAAKH